MKKRKPILLLLAAVLPFLLSGCMKFSLYIEVDRDQNIDYHGSLYVPETAVSGKDDLDLMYDELFKGIPLLNDRISSETEIEGQKYIGCTFNGTAEQLQKLATTEQVNSQMHLRFSSDQILKNVDALPLDLDVFNEKSGSTDISSFKEFGAEAYLEIKMPGQILSSSHGEIDKDTVRIDLYDALGEDIEVVSLIRKPEIEAEMAGICGVSAAFYALVLYRDSKRKKETK
jgi:hypothetical protein